MRGNREEWAARQHRINEESMKGVSVPGEEGIKEHVLTSRMSESGIHVEHTVKGVSNADKTKISDILISDIASVEDAMRLPDVTEKKDLGSVIVLSGMSSVGKTSIANEIMRQNKRWNQGDAGLNIKVWGLDLNNCIEGSGMSVFEIAVLNANKGISTILDLGPSTVSSISGGLKRAGGEDFECPITYCSFHLPLENIVERVLGRNLVDYAPMSIQSTGRYMYSPYSGYKAMFAPLGVNDSRTKVEETLTREVLNDVAEIMKGEGPAGMRLSQQAMKYWFGSNEGDSVQIVRKL